MVARPTKRPMPWSTCTTRSPAARLATSVSASTARLRRRAAAHQPVAEHVLVADDGEVRRLEAGFERQHGDAGRALRQRLELGESSTGFSAVRPWSSSTWPRRSRAPSLQEASITLRPASFSAAMCATSASKTLTSPAARSAAKERPVRPPMSIAAPLLPGCAKGLRAARGGGRREPSASLARKIERLGRDRLVGHGAGRRLLPRRRGAPRSGRAPARARSPIVSSTRWSTTTGASGQVVEQRLQPLVEERQPVLHAGEAAAFADRLVERVAAGDGAEGVAVILAEAADRLLGQDRPRSPARGRGAGPGRWCAGSTGRRGGSSPACRRRNRAGRAPRCPAPRGRRCRRARRIRRPRARWRCGRSRWSRATPSAAPWRRRCRRPRPRRARRRSRGRARAG